MWPAPSSLLWSAEEAASQPVTPELNKLIKKAGYVIGCSQETYEVVVGRRTLSKLLSIMDNQDHLLLHTLDVDVLNKEGSVFSKRRSFLLKAMSL